MHVRSVGARSRINHVAAMAVVPQTQPRMQRGGRDGIGLDGIGLEGRPLEQASAPADTWRKVCRFQPVGQLQTLAMVVEAVERAMERYQRRDRDSSIERPLVVFDLDDTLFRSNQTRTWRILREWLAERPNLHHAVRRRLEVLTAESLAYRVADSFVKVAGLDPTKPHVKAALADFESYWKQRFFSDAYCKDDPVQRGAVAFVRRIHELGANIAYLSGRDEPGMGKGTRRAIAMSGLPRPSSRVKMFLKPTPDMDDAEFKKSVRAKLAAWGPVIATFDNAPANCVVLKDAFPRALNVFVDTIFDPGPVRIRHGLFTVSDFRTHR